MAQEKGLYPKYTVINNENGLTVGGAFVLVPDKDYHARIALAAYAESVTDFNRALAIDLLNWLDRLNETPLPPGEPKYPPLSWGDPRYEDT